MIGIEDTREAANDDYRNEHQSDHRHSKDRHSRDRSDTSGRGTYVFYIVSAAIGVYRRKELSILGGKWGMFFWNQHFLVTLNANFLQIKLPTSDDFLPHHFVLKNVMMYSIIL